MLAFIIIAIAVIIFILWGASLGFLTQSRLQSMQSQIAELKSQIKALQDAQKTQSS
ncbi:hypothetical protein [uncultured Helicobacter sp.]|uniref:hypothetical protein n=1 Tax=uncultured Helicobacter sp. TaxID=175537 RepID=UPI00258547C3|nr:hypothetical protein [uncultured Helicobacter sp.]